MESVGSYVHLVGADFGTHPDIVLTANHVERVGDGKNVGSTRKRGESAITQRPETTVNTRRSQSATDASQVCPRNAQFLRLATTTSERCNIVENPVVAYAHLINAGRSENVGFGQSDIPSVVGYILSAAERILLRESGRTARDEGCGLIKTEAAEQRILSREIVVNTNIK